MVSLPIIYLTFFINHERFYKSGHNLRFDGNHFSGVEDPKYNHWRAKLGSYQGRPFITGGHANPAGKTEIFSTNSLQWQFGTDYPFTSPNEDNEG